MFLFYVLIISHAIIIVNAKAKMAPYEYWPQILVLPQTLELYEAT